ncbi:hypothetical protein MNB_SM-3-651 [hydrothermal vent metagenome]|uniref:Uncharacterized protein n=1 Tax=hydrothermal vent metagenome TaxID=652676 RepID=A0A1W1D4X2_9ZZZZ
MLYVPLVFFALTQLFASMHYILYLFNEALFFLFQRENLSSVHKIFLGVYLLFLYGIYTTFEEQRYYFYLWLNIEDSVIYMKHSVVLILNFLHLLLL